MLLSRFFNDRRAAVAPLLALAAVPILGAASAAVDFSRASNVRTAMQAALDSTALMLAKEERSVAGTATAAQATSYFTSMFTHAELADLEIKAAVATGSNGMTVALTAAGSLKTRFMSALGIPTMNIAARAEAAAYNDGFGCVLALDASASGAITAQGNTSVALTDCSLYDNSADLAALKAGGSAKIVARSVGVVGGVSGEENIVTTDGIRTGAGAVSDPYADVSLPALSGCTENNFTGKTVQTIEPGVYCGGIMLNAGAVVTLNPGIYYLDRGSLHLNGGATLIGRGVTLVFTSSTEKNWATASVNGNAVIDLTPPISGPTAGIVVFADRRVPAGTAYKFNGGATQYFGGAVYVPTGDLEFAGGAGTSVSCTQLIGGTVTFTGNANLAINCSAYRTRPFGPAVVRLSS
jgi:hypothetical protein